MSWHPDDSYDASALEREQDAEALSPDAVMDALRADIARIGSQVGWCRLHAVGPGYLGDVLAERRPPGPKILHALNLRHAIVRTRP